MNDRTTYKEIKKDSEEREYRMKDNKRKKDKQMGEEETEKDT